MAIKKTLPAVVAPPVLVHTLAGQKLTLTFSDVKNLICGGQRHTPSDAEVVAFMHFCRAKEANPWEKDAHLIKYDASAPASFVLGVGHYNKLAASDPDYNGCKFGIIVQREDGALEERKGTLLLPGERLIGGWAEAYNKKREIPTYVSVNLDTYDQKQSRWNKDKPGMIAKVAVVQAKREAFPRKLSGAYIEEEIGVANEQTPSAPPEDEQEEIEAELWERTRLFLVDRGVKFEEDDMRAYLEHCKQTFERDGDVVPMSVVMQRAINGLTNDENLKIFKDRFDKFVKKNRPKPEPTPETKTDTGEITLEEMKLQIVELKREVYWGIADKKFSAWLSAFVECDEIDRLDEKKARQVLDELSKPLIDSSLVQFCKIEPTQEALLE